MGKKREKERRRRKIGKWNGEIVGGGNRNEVVKGGQREQEKCK